MQIIEQNQKKYHVIRRIIADNLSEDEISDIKTFWLCDAVLRRHELLPIGNNNVRKQPQWVYYFCQSVTDVTEHVDLIA